MTFDEIKDKFSDRIKKDAGDSFQCTCPGHDDNHASLSISKGEHGKTTVHCHAGCDVNRILAPVGLSVKDLFSNGSAPKPQADPVVARYDYQDESGGVVFRVERRQSKKFAQCRPDPDRPGQWLYNLKGTNRVLYHLPELVAASPEAWVMLPEGEKDVDRLRKAGYIATTNAGGAGKWQANYSQALQGRRVCILPDNDEAGRNHALTVGSQLADHTVDLRILELPDLPPKGDVSDWLNAGNNAAALADLVEAAPTFASWAEGQSKKSADPKPSTGKVKGTADLWIEALKALGLTFRLNVLEDMVEVDGRRLDDVTRSKIYLAMVSTGIPKTYIDDVINVLAAENTYHPVQEYLNKVASIYDGQDHLTTLLQHIRGDDREVTYGDGKKAQLHWLLIRRWLLGCVARALDGDKKGAFKHQTPMLVFVGKQGIGKSSLVRWLVSGLGYEFHRESPINPHGPDDIRSMVTQWIWEVSELGSSLRKGDRDALKGFITQEWHTYRKPWGRASITKPTLCNFVGTINPETGFLDDPTGHRRFLPIHVTAINHAYEKAVDVNQLWAQLVHLYRNGTSPELSKLEKQALAGTYTEHEVENPLQTYLQMYFTVEPDNTELKCFTADIILRLQSFGISVSSNAKVAGREINDALAPLGLERKFVSIGNIKGRGWIGIQPNKLTPPRRELMIL